MGQVLEESVHCDVVLVSRCFGRKLKGSVTIFQGENEA